MAGIINTGTFTKDLKPLVKRWFGDAYKNYDPQWAKIFAVEESSDNSEEFATYAGMNLAQIKAEGASISYDSMEQFYVVRAQHVVYATGFSITREMIEDGKSLNIAKRRAVEIKKAMLDAKEYVHANILNRAFNSSYVWGDGKELCATDHPTFGADLSNEMTTPLDLSEAALEQSMIDIQSFINNRGLKIQTMGKQLVVPKELQFEAARYLKTELRPGTTDNDINAMNYLGMLQTTPIVHQYLTDTDAYFILTDINDSVNGLKCLQRRAMEMGEDNDFDTENAKFKATERYSPVVIDCRAIYGCTGA